ALPSRSLLAGARYSDVRFGSDDHYITATNPNDSGRLAFSHASPVAGIVWHAAKNVNVYANWGNGFETPTFIELAYRNIGTGLNFGLQPAISRSSEIGVKAYVFETQRVNLAVFNINTTNEIIIDAAPGLVSPPTWKFSTRTSCTATTATPMLQRVIRSPTPVPVSSSARACGRSANSCASTTSPTATMSGR